MDVSENSGTPKSSMLIGLSIINHPFWGTPNSGNTHMNMHVENHDLQGRKFTSGWIVGLSELLAHV